MAVTTTLALIPRDFRGECGPLTIIASSYCDYSPGLTITQSKDEHIEISWAQAAALAVALDLLVRQKKDGT